MPIAAPDLPPDAVAAVRRALAATGRFPRRRGAALSLTLPHPVFTVGLEALAARRPLSEAAELAGWRALLEEDRTVVAAVEVAVPAAGAAISDASINRGAFVQSTVEALDAAERDDRVASKQFEIRLLRVVALYVVALWLRSSEDAASDLFVPLAPAPSPLKAGVAFEAEQFEGDLAGMAEALVSAYDAAERPDELGS